MNQSSTSDSVRNSKRGSYWAIVMGVTCECGSVLKDVIGLRRHKTRSCKLGRNTTTCPDCSLEWQNLQSLNQHRRQAHPVEYQRSLEIESNDPGRRRHRAWSALELRQLAQLEVDYDEGREKLALNYYLAEKLGRTYESIKGRRRDEKYKDLVTELQQSRISEGEAESECESEDGFGTPPSSPVGYNLRLRPSTGIVYHLEESNSMTGSEGSDLRVNAPEYKIGRAHV